MSTIEKLTALRKLMHQHHLDFYFVPARDAHNNEYVPSCWQRRAWISEFTGSAGDALIGLDQAYLWTDSRYFLQAEYELDSSHFQLMKQLQGAPPLQQWFIQNASKKTVGVDPRLITINQFQQWQKALESIGGRLVAEDENLIDQAWQNRPELPANPLRQYPLEHAGYSAKEKIADLRQVLHQQSAQAHVITMLDSIAWLFNIRGTDIEYNPLIICYAIISSSDAILFIDSGKVSSADQLYLQSQGISLQPYNAFSSALNQLKGKVWVDPDSCSWWAAKQLTKATLFLDTSPLLLMKACKNPVEIQGMHEAHRHDALAMIKFLHWIEINWPNQVSEISAAEQLEKFRREAPECLDLSFPTISGFAANGAIVHYHANENTNRWIDDSNLYLIDSGGQYLSGTTDITRTIHLGHPTPQQKYHYTLVLKGHLALRHTAFPLGTCGEHLDALARHPLWKAGFNYGHGTGHGVGCYLCVHEGPQRISPGQSKVALLPNMVLSNEPGLYFPEQYGIRIENLCTVIEHSPEISMGPTNGPFYTFEDLTKVPYAKNLIDTDLLTNDEIKWINEYHAEIYELLFDDLTTEQRDWLASATSPL